MTRNTYQFVLAIAYQPDKVLTMTKTTNKKATLANLKKTQTSRAIDRAAWKAIVFSATISTIVTDAIDADLAQSMSRAAEVRS